MVGDVSGKGLSAAAHITEVKYALRAFLRETPRPGHALARLNDFICEAQRQDDWGNASLVVLALAVIDPATGEVTYASAGAEPLLVLPPPARPDADIQEVGARERPRPGRRARAGRIRRRRSDAAAGRDAADDDRRHHRGPHRARRCSALTASSAWSRECRRRGPVGEISRAILDGARAFAGGALTDDACILLAQRC